MSNGKNLNFDWSPRSVERAQFEKISIFGGFYGAQKSILGMSWISARGWKLAKRLVFAGFSSKNGQFWAFLVQNLWKVAEKPAFFRKSGALIGSLTLAPIWLPHWPAWRWTISRIFSYICTKKQAIFSTEKIYSQKLRAALFLATQSGGARERTPPHSERGPRHVDYQIGNKNAYFSILFIKNGRVLHFFHMQNSLQAR